MSKDKELDDIRCRNGYAGINLITYIPFVNELIETYKDKDISREQFSLAMNHIREILTESAAILVGEEGVRELMKTSDQQFRNHKKKCRVKVDRGLN